MTMTMFFVSEACLVGLDHMVLLQTTMLLWWSIFMLLPISVLVTSLQVRLACQPDAGGTRCDLCGKLKMELLLQK